MASKIAKFSESIMVLVIKGIPINNEKDAFQFFRSLLHSKSERQIAVVDRKSGCDSKRQRDTVSHYLRLKEEESVVGTRISRRTWRHPLIKYKCSPAVAYYRDVDVAKAV